MKKLSELTAKKESAKPQPEPVIPEDVKLLKEILEELKKKN